MDSRFNPTMLVLARESRGLTQKEFARMVGVTQATVSRYEGGTIDPPSDALEDIAIALDYPTIFFTQTESVYGVGSGCEYFHRKRQDLSAKELKKLHATANVLRIAVGKILSKFAHDNNFYKHLLNNSESPGIIANIARKQWDIPLGPVDSVMGTIEAAGGIVLTWPFDTSRIDAFSQWPQGMPPFFFVNADAPADRIRWTIAHELGHVLMHDAPREGMEREADQFAAEFLLPANEIRPELIGMSLPLAARLKPKWKTSMAALARRACDLRCITEWEYRKLFMQLSQSGMRIREPNPIPPEHPATLNRMLLHLFYEDFYDIPTLCGVLKISEGDFKKYILKNLDVGLSA